MSNCKLARPVSPFGIVPDRRLLCRCRAWRLQASAAALLTARDSVPDNCTEPREEKQRSVVASLTSGWGPDVSTV